MSDKEVLRFTPEGKDKTALRLVSQKPLKIHNGAAVAEFTLRAGESAIFVLEEARPSAGDAVPSARFRPGSFKETLNFWQAWMDRCHYRGRWREVVNRSALTLKLLISQEHGSLVAAPTFGLPEIEGGEKNWDYRFTWIRDACFTIDSLMALGYRDEAAAFMAWMEDRCREIAETGHLQVMYGIDGRHDLSESNLRHMNGYRDSRPVRIGNAAFDQSQIDICGELINTAYLYDSAIEPISNEMWDHLSRIINWAGANWRKKGSGIWEYRDYHRQFLYSELMCWQALDRGIRLAHRRSLPAPLAKWVRARNMIYNHIFKSCWNPKQQAFVQSPGSALLDSANLQMLLTGFIGPTDSRWISTLKAMEARLMSDTLVYRYERHGPQRRRTVRRTRGPSASARSGTSNASPAPAMRNGRACFLKRCSATQTIWASTPRSSARVASISEIFRRLTLISASSHRPWNSTGGSPPGTNNPERYCSGRRTIYAQLFLRI